jgi:hypothetical protein
MQTPHSTEPKLRKQAISKQWRSAGAHDGRFTRGKRRGSRRCFPACAGGSAVTSAWSTGLPVDGAERDDSPPEPSGESSLREAPNEASEACDIFARKLNGGQRRRLVGDSSAPQRSARQTHRQHNLRSARRRHALLVADLEEPLMLILSAFAACEKI